MSDLFHEDVPEDFIRNVFVTMARAHWHIFQILTKRAKRLAEMAGKLPLAPECIGKEYRLRMHDTPREYPISQRSPLPFDSYLWSRSWGRSRT